MSAMLLVTLLATGAAGATLEQGLKREITLLVSEEAGLRRELERLQALRAARVGALQRDLATLEVKAVEAARGEAAARAALASLAPTGSPAPVADAGPAMREALVQLGLTAPAAGGADPVVDLLSPAVDRLEAWTSPQRVETGFFAPDGTWLQGAVLRVGPIGVAAANGDGAVAGPLVPTDDGTLQLASSSSPAATEAARQLVAGGAPPLWPLAWGGADDPASSSARARAGLLQRLEALGWTGVVVMLTLLLAVGAALAHVVVAVRRHRGVAAVAGRLVGLVSAGETVAAAALARTVGGASGRFLVAVIAVVGRATPEDEVAALSAEATASLQRATSLVRGLFSVAIAVTVLAAASAIDAALVTAPATDALLAGMAVGVLPLGLLAGASVPVVAAVVVGEAVVARTRELLEVTALRLLDAASRRT